MIDFVESDRKADGGIKQLIVVGIIVHVAAEIVGFQPDFAEESFGQAHFEIIALRKAGPEAEDIRIERFDRGRTGEQDILE